MLLSREIKTRKFKVKPAPKATPMELPLSPTIQPSTIELQKIHSADSKSVDTIFNLARNRNWEEINDLLESGKLNVQAKDQDKTTLLHIAVFQNNLRMVKKLVSRGADINAVNDSNRHPGRCV